MLCYTVLYYTILYYAMLCYTILYYTILYYTILCVFLYDIIVNVAKVEPRTETRLPQPSVSLHERHECFLRHDGSHVAGLGFRV